VSSNRSEQRKLAADISEYLTFFICEVEYAVSLEHVREVIPYDGVTRVPGMPDTVRGVTNLRGSVVPVIDLAIKFSLPQIEITPRTCIVLVEAPFGGNVLLLGLLTEQVGQVLGIDRNELLTPPSFGTPVHTDYLEGMLPMGKKFALALDIARVLSQDELLASQSIPAEADTNAASATAEPAIAIEDEGWETTNLDNGASGTGTENEATS
jgi:purine-binding chemotaxis protein CheW